LGRPDRRHAEAIEYRMGGFIASNRAGGELHAFNYPEGICRSQNMDKFCLPLSELEQPGKCHKTWIRILTAYDKLLAEILECLHSGFGWVCL